MQNAHQIEKFGTVPLFETLEHSEISELLKVAEDVSVEPGQLVLKQGAPGDGLYIISAGRFEVLKAGNKEELIAQLESFSSFGDMSLVSDNPCSASVLCQEAGRLKRFPKASFNALLDSGHPAATKVLRNMCRLMANRLAYANERLVQ